MNRFLVIPFEFSQSEYYSLIMCKENFGWTEYRITVMNGELEQLLFNNNVIREIDGSLHLDISENKQQAQLKLAIARSLEGVLKVPIKESVHRG